MLGTNILLKIEQTIKKHTLNYDIKFNIVTGNQINMGTVSSNFLLILKSKKISQEIIDKIIKSIERDLMDLVEKYEIVNNFFNIHLKDHILFNHIEEILKKDPENFLTWTPKTEEFVKKQGILHLEYGSINPTGPVHLGHLRAIIVAQCLCNLYNVLNVPIYKEFFLNNCGTQIDKFIESIYLRWQEKNGIKITQDIPYKGDYIKTLIPELEPLASLEDMKKHEESTIENVKNKTLNELHKLGVYYDTITYESKLRSNKPLILKVFNLLVEKKLLGIIENGNEDLVDLDQDVEPFNLFLKEIPQKTVILLTKELGFEKNKVIAKNQNLTYFGADIIYLYEKYSRNFFSQYCFLGEDHIGHLTMLQKLAPLIFNNLKFIPKKVGFVKVFNEKREMIPMSKRSGKFLSMEQAVKIIGLDFLKIIMISRNMNSELIFHINNSQEQNLSNNCLFYIQYAYARICSVLNKVDVNEYHWQDFCDKNLNLLDEEKYILRHLFWMEWSLNNWAIDQDVNGIYQYIYDLAGYFHSYFNIGSTNPSLKFITQDKNYTSMRIHILLAIKKSLGLILKHIIGIIPMEKM
jgi:arginyl-tRNA synthetase